MKYTYELDNLKRFKYLKPAQEGEESVIEITKADFRNVICGFHGLVNGEIKVIGFTNEEKKIKANHDKTHRIEELKKLLAETDWKVVVNQERQLAGLPPKYDPILLHEERQAWRDEINLFEDKNKI